MQKLVGLGILIGCSGGSVMELPDTSDTLSIQLVTGDHQKGLVFTALPEELVVRVENQRGEPVSGVPVRFDVDAVDGLVSASPLTPIVETDESGRAATVLVLGDVEFVPVSTPGSPAEHVSRVSATIDGDAAEPVTFETTTQNLFGAHFNFTEGTPESAGLADFDGDGKPDLFFVRGEVFSAALNTVPAASHIPVFGDLIDLTLAPTADAKLAATGDLDGDGKTDLAISLPNLGMVALLINQTDLGASVPSFSKILLSTNAAVSGVQVAIADLDSDGNLDLLVANDSTVDIFRVTPVLGSDPSFERSTVSTIASLRGCTTADLDMDSRPDLILTSATQQLSVLRNTTVRGATTPSFATSIELSTTAVPSGVAAGDIDGDGKTDLVVREGGDIDVFTNTSSGSSISLTRSSVTTSSSPTTGTPLLADLNQDGRLDIVITALSAGANQVSMLFGSPLPGKPFLLQNYVLGSSGTSPSQPAAGDLDGDGRLDLVLTNRQFNRLAVIVQGQ